MCGITGFYGLKDEGTLKKMNASLIHRGPDEEGFFQSNNCSLAMRRLSIIDLESGSQPYFNEDRTIVVVFNGEIYNFQEIRAELEKKGHNFMGRSDGEVIPHLYEEYGKNLCIKMRGMFALAVYDIKSDILFAARDHFGIKPLYYFTEKNFLFFASELKALKKIPFFESKIDENYIADYFTFLYGRKDKTIYKKAKKLPASHFLVMDKNGLKIERYWKFPALSKEKIDKHFLEEIDYMLSESVKEQLVSDVPLGIFLSGGMDSSSLLYYASRYRTIDTFTVSYSKENGYDEGDIAAKTAAMFNSRNTRLDISISADEMEKIISILLDQPFADSSIIPNYLISKEARKYIKTAISGLGGDEVFAGYPRYTALRLSNFYRPLHSYIGKISLLLSQKMSERYNSSNTKGRIKRFFAGFETDNPYKHWISYIKDYERNKFLKIDTATCKIDNFDELCVNPSRFEFENYLEGDLLYLSDLSSMAASLEVRVPFLDIRLVEKVASLPLPLRMRFFKLKYLLKKIMIGRLPDEVFKGKRGFQLPIAMWFSKELKDFAIDLISSSDGVFYDRDYAMKLLKEHIENKQDNSDIIYAICALELWLKNEKK